MKPRGVPIGLQVARTSKAVGRAFNAALGEVGGSLPTWLVLTNLKQAQWRTQHELARALDIEGPTLTRHLDSLEQAGLVTRRRHPTDRRAIQVELTEAGHELHQRLRLAVIAFDRQLRAGISDEEIAQLSSLLNRLEQNVRG